MRHEIFELEGVKYTIRRFSTKEQFEVLTTLREEGEYEANVRAVELALTEPKLSREQIEGMDGAHFNIINWKIGTFNVIPLGTAENSSTATAATPR